NKQVIVPLCYGSVAVNVNCYLLTPWQCCRKLSTFQSKTVLTDYDVLWYTDDELIAVVNNTQSQSKQVAVEQKMNHIYNEDSILENDIERDWELYNSPFGTTNVVDVQSRLAASQPYMKSLIDLFSDVFSEQPGRT
ncbi:hypothetical protein A3Q56_08660, partial [Intoshia linei]